MRECPDKRNEWFLQSPGGFPEWRGGCWLWCSGSESAVRVSRQVGEAEGFMNSTANASP